MSEKNNGGPAFGQVVELRCVRLEMDGSAEYEPEAMMPGGLSVRDYFAAKAMRPLTQNMTTARKDEMDAMTKEAYAIADAMLRARDA